MSQDFSLLHNLVLLMVTIYGYHGPTLVGLLLTTHFGLNGITIVGGGGEGGLRGYYDFTEPLVT